MIRTLLPLSFVLAGVAAQAPTPPPGPDIIDLDARVFANATWVQTGPVAEPEWTLWVGAAGAGLRDQRGPLEDLQRRFGARSVRIAVVAEPDDAKGIAAAKPPFAVASLAGAHVLCGTCWLTGDSKAPIAVNARPSEDQKPVAAAVDGGRAAST